VSIFKEKGFRLFLHISP